MVKCIARRCAVGGACVLAMAAWSLSAGAEGGQQLSFEDRRIQQRYARLGCEKDLVACVDAESGRIVSRQMSSSPFAARSGELWTVKVVGPKRLAASYTFEEHRGTQLYSTVRGSSAGAEKKTLTDVQTEVKEAANTLQRLDASPETTEAVQAARRATSGGQEVRAKSALEEAQKKAQVVLDARNPAKKTRTRSSGHRSSWSMHWRSIGASSMRAPRTSRFWRATRSPSPTTSRWVASR